MSPNVVPAAEWLAARKELQTAEEEAVRAVEELAARRRELPAVAVEKDYVFEGPEGFVSFPELFEGRRQLAVYHFMFPPGTEEPCTGCSPRPRRPLPKSGAFPRWRRIVWPR